LPPFPLQENEYKFNITGINTRSEPNGCMRMLLLPLIGVKAAADSYWLSQPQ